MTDGQRLDSWKDIARFLGRDVRTVVRWEQHRGLPVHRVPGGRRPRVFAYPSELREWLAQGGAAGEPTNSDATAAQPTPFLRSRRAQVAAAATLLMLAGVAAARAWMRVPIPTEVRLAGRRLVALDVSGRPVWEHAFASSDLMPGAARVADIADLDRDGRVDIVATVEVSPPKVNQHHGELLRFSSDGTMKWSITPQDRFGFREAEYGSPWASADFAVYRTAAQESRISWAVHHFTWWPGLLITTNASGERIGTFVNSGWIRVVRPSRDGRYLFISGVTNSRRAYFVAVLDANHPVGHSPEPAGSPTECLTCPAGDPIRYFVFPRTDVGSGQSFPADGPALQTSDDGTLQVQTYESVAPDVATAIYELSSDFRIRTATLSDAFWDLHRRLEQQGLLHHAAETCPERGGVEIEEWTPANGWKTEKVAVH